MGTSDSSEERGIGWSGAEMDRDDFERPPRFLATSFVEPSLETAEPVFRRRGFDCFLALGASAPSIFQIGKNESLFLFGLFADVTSPGSW